MLLSTKSTRLYPGYYIDANLHTLCSLLSEILAIYVYCWTFFDGRKFTPLIFQNDYIDTFVNNLYMNTFSASRWIPHSSARTKLFGTKSKLSLTKKFCPWIKIHNCLQIGCKMTLCFRQNVFIWTILILSKWMWHKNIFFRKILILYRWMGHKVIFFTFQELLLMSM